MHWSLSLTLRYIIFKFFLWFISLYSFQDSNQTDSNYFFLYLLSSLHFLYFYISMLHSQYIFLFYLPGQKFCLLFLFNLLPHTFLEVFNFNYYFFHSRCYLVLFKVYGFFMFFFF